MLLPAKLQSGQNFKTATVKAVNSIIDYLKTQRIVGDGKTIRVNQLTSGVALSAIISQGGRGGSGGDSFNHPFKLKVTSDENGNPQLGMTFGVVYLQSSLSLGQFYGIGYEKIEGVEDVPEYFPFDWQSIEDGVYGVHVVVYQTSTEEGSAFNIATFLTSATQVQIPYAPGFYSLCVGLVKKETTETEEGDSKIALSIDSQGIIGDIIISDENISDPFAIRFNVDFDPEDGEIKEASSFTVSAYINNGMIYTSEDVYALKDENGQIAIEEGEYWAYFQNGEIIWTQDISTLELNSNCFLIAGFMYQNGCILHEQFIHGDIILGSGGNGMHPFKLYIQTDQETGKQNLKMFSGDMYIQSSKIQIVRFEEENLEIDVTSLEDGVYMFFVSAQFSMDGEIKPKVFIGAENVTTSDIPSLSGFYSFPVGAFEVYTTETEAGDFIQGLNVIYQCQNSCLIVDDRYYDLPFCCKVCIDFDDTKVISGIKDFTVEGAVISDGAIYDQNVPQEYRTEIYQVISDKNNYKPSSGKNYCYLQGKREEETGLTVWEILWSTEDLEKFKFDGETIVEQNYLLSIFENNEKALAVQNFHPSDFVFGKSDTYKVKTNDDSYPATPLQDDKKPGFLIDKLYSGHRKIGAQDGEKTWEEISQGDSMGYIYMQLQKQGDENGSQLWLYWDYPNINGWSEQYLTLNCKDNHPIWQPQGWIRIDANDTSPSFLPDKVTAKEPIKIEPKEGKLEFSIDMSKFTGSIKNSEGGCFTIEDVSSDPVNLGKEYELKLDEDCLFNKLKITAEHPVIVTGGGKEWKISFDDSEFVKTVSGGDCIKADKNGDNVKIDVDLDCIFENLSITGNAPISVTQDGKSFTISIDQEELGGGKLEEGDCIKIQDGTEEGAKKISVNKDCIFETFTITGDDYITVTGEKATWNLKLNPEVFGKVKVSETDTLGFLGEKIVSTNFIVAQNYGNSIGFQIGEDAIQCGDDSLEIYVTNGFATINSYGKLRVSANGDLGYLEQKIQTSDSSLFIQTTGDTIDIWLNKDIFTSSDESILIQKGDTIDFKATGKVKVSENDSPDYLGAKIKIDSSLASLIAIENTGSEILFKSAIQGSGIMLVNNGSITLLQAPSGKAVLVSQNGSLSWKEYETCENACQEEN